MSNPVKQFYELGPFRIDVANRLLLRDGEPLPLTPKAVDTLLAQFQDSGQALNKRRVDEARLARQRLALTPSAESGK